MSKKKEYGVVVDSMADFELGFEDPNISIVQTPVNITDLEAQEDAELEHMGYGPESFKDASPDEFYDRQQEVFEENEERRKKKRLGFTIKTSQPTAYDIKEALVKILKSGRDAIYVATASTLTGAFNSGKTAVELVNEDYDFKNRAICIDGLSMSALTAILVRQAVKICDTTKQFIDFIYDRRNDTEHFFAVEEWEAFKNSGRISPTTLMIANFIKIKPLMRFDYDETGHRAAYCARKHQSTKILCTHMAKTLHETIDPEFNLAMVIHAQNPDYARKLVREIKKYAPEVNLIGDPDETDRFRMGPATGVHLGYSAVGLAFLRKKGLYDNAEFHREHQLFSESVVGL